jgi:seryl-tRNA synthetase
MVISIELIRSDPNLVKKLLRQRGEDAPVEQIIDMDNRRKAIVSKTDDLRARRNSVSKDISQNENISTELIQEMRNVGNEIKTLDAETKILQKEINELLLIIPNIPQDDVPIGEDDTSNEIVRTIGSPRTFSFNPLPHWTIGERLGIIDLERGAKLSGARFFVLKGKGAKLQRALISWMLDLHVDEHDYEEIYLPNLVTQKTVTSSGHFPKFADTMYHDNDDDLWMIPTAEVPITNLLRDEILPPNMLPIYYAAHTPCFRREKTAAGRDTRGIKRVHQFEKVEMYKFVEPDESETELQRLVSDAEEICIQLGITHRVLQLCTGDLGFSAVKGYDIEIWAPGSSEWLEVSSCSNCTDFQARRASIRYRPELGARPKFVNTLNGSGLALPRVIIAILENYQESDGSVTIPDVLRPYTGFDRIE